MKSILRILYFFIITFLNVNLSYAQYEKSPSITENTHKIKTHNVIVHPSLKPFTFHGFVHPKTNTIEKIDIYHKGTSNLIQTIEVYLDVPTYKEPQYFETIDLNFDGYKDFKILSWQGATGNAGFNIWTYSPTEKCFIFAEKLSQLSNPIPNIQNQTIHSYHKGGHTGKIYDKRIWKYIEGELQLIEAESQDWNKKNQHYIKTIKRLKNSKMTLVHQQIIPEYANQY